MNDFRGHTSADSRPSGEIFVFVDECYRTQSGKLHKAMKAILPGVTLIGFAGTRLLKSDKQRSIETFGPYIHRSLGEIAACPVTPGRAGFIVRGQ